MVAYKFPIDKNQNKFIVQANISFHFHEHPKTTSEIHQSLQLFYLQRGFDRTVLIKKNIVWKSTFPRILCCNVSLFILCFLAHTKIHFLVTLIVKVCLLFYLTNFNPKRNNKVCKHILLCTVFSMNVLSFVLFKKFI